MNSIAKKLKINPTLYLQKVQCDTDYELIGGARDKSIVGIPHMILFFKNEKDDRVVITVNQETNQFTKMEIPEGDWISHYKHGKATRVRESL